MTVDEPGHRRPALGIDSLEPRGGRGPGRHRRDPAAPHDYRTLLDDLAGADDDAGVGDDEILGRSWSGPDRRDDSGDGDEGGSCFHDESLTAGNQESRIGVRT